MATDFQILADRRLVVSRVWGAVTKADLLESRESLAAAPGFDPDFDRILDLSEAEMEFDATAVRDLAFALPTIPGTARRAIVASDAALFGMSRMFQSVRDDPHLRVFRSLGEALRWLGHPEDAL